MNTTEFSAQAKSPASPDLPANEEPPKQKKATVQIAVAVGWSAVGVALLCGVYSNGNMWPAAFAILGLALMGAALGYFACGKK